MTHVNTGNVRAEVLICYLERGGAAASWQAHCRVFEVRRPGTNHGKERLATGPKMSATIVSLSGTRCRIRLVTCLPPWIWSWWWQTGKVPSLSIQGSKPYEQQVPSLILVFLLRRLSCSKNRYSLLSWVSCCVSEWERLQLLSCEDLHNL